MRLASKARHHGRGTIQKGGRIWLAFGDVINRSYAPKNA